MPCDRAAARQGDRLRWMRRALNCKSIRRVLYSSVILRMPPSLLGKDYKVQLNLPDKSKFENIKKYYKKEEYL